MSWAKDQKKMNLERKSCDVLILLYHLKWISTMWCIGTALFLTVAWCERFLVSKKWKKTETS